MRKLIQFVNALSRFYQNVKRSGITSNSQRRQGAKDQVEMIAMHCFYYISPLHSISSGIFSAPALSKSSTDARASLCGILRAGAKNLARQNGSIIPRSALKGLADFTRIIDTLDNVSWFTRCCVAGSQRNFDKASAGIFGYEGRRGD